jgi:hypothetical protein
MRRLIALALLVTSCGSSESDKTAPFVGSWTVTTGTLTAMCPAPIGTNNQKLDGGQQTITKAADGSLTIAILPGCNVTLDVSGNAANLRVTMPPQTCMLSFMGLPVMGSFTGGNFTVNGQTATFSYMGNATLGAIVCPVSATGMSMKGVPADGGSTSPDGGSTTPDTGSTTPDAASSDGP